MSGSGKTEIFHEDARRKMLTGVNTLADAVAPGINEMSY
jgi:chaperonin GroEL (HSP60 family)